MPSKYSFFDFLSEGAKPHPSVAELLAEESYGKGTDKYKAWEQSELRRPEIAGLQQDFLDELAMDTIAGGVMSLGKAAPKALKAVKDLGEEGAIKLSNIGKKTLKETARLHDPSKITDYKKRVSREFLKLPDGTRVDLNDYISRHGEVARFVNDNDLYKSHSVAKKLAGENSNRGLLEHYIKNEDFIRGAGGGGYEIGNLSRKNFNYIKKDFIKGIKEGTISKHQDMFVDLIGDETKISLSIQGQKVNSIDIDALNKYIKSIDTKEVASRIKNMDGAEIDKYIKSLKDIPPAPKGMRISVQTGAPSVLPKPKLTDQLEYLLDDLPNDLSTENFNAIKELRESIIKNADPEELKILKKIENKK